MSKRAKDRPGFFDELTKGLARAKAFETPTQLFALALFVVVIVLVVFVLVSSPQVPYGFLTAVIVLLILALYTIGFRSSRRSEPDPEAVQVRIPVELISDLRVEAPILDRIVGPLRSLGFDVFRNATSTHWGRAFLYTIARKEKRTVCIAALAPEFFADGESWRSVRWFNVLVDVPQERITDLVVFSETDIVCAAALYEEKDIRRLRNVTVILVTKWVIDTLRLASTSENDVLATIRLYLAL